MKVTEAGNVNNLVMMGPVFFAYGAKQINNFSKKDWASSSLLCPHTRLIIPYFHIHGTGRVFLTGFCIKTNFLPRQNKGLSY